MIAAQKLMKFMIDLVSSYGLRDSIETDGNHMPIMYAFGQTTAKACVIRFKSHDLAKTKMQDLRNNGTIEYEAAGETRKIRINSGFDNRTPEQKAAEYQMRKMRSAILHHEVPRETWFTEWKHVKLWVMPEGRWEHKQEIVRWNSKEWKLEFQKNLMETSPLWRSIRKQWGEMIQNKKDENDFAFESKEEHKKSGTDGDWSATDAPSGGDEEARHWQSRAH